MNWPEISHQVRQKLNNFHAYDPKTIRERYFNYLSPDLQRKQWSLEDDIALLKLVK